MLEATRSGTSCGPRAVAALPRQEDGDNARATVWEPAAVAIGLGGADSVHAHQLAQRARLEERHIKEMAEASCQTVAARRRNFRRNATP
jgi:hypothetical protein